MKYFTSLCFLLASGCGLQVHSDPVKVDPLQVQVSTTINYALAQQFCSSQCSGNTTCASQCYDQFLAILTASSAEPIPSPSPSPTP
jgi:hypothetical protein